MEVVAGKGYILVGYSRRSKRLEKVMDNLAKFNAILQIGQNGSIIVLNHIL